MSYPNRSQLDPQVRAALDWIVSQMEVGVTSNQFVEINGHRLFIGTTQEQATFDGRVNDVGIITTTEAAGHAPTGTSIIINTGGGSGGWE